MSLPKVIYVTTTRLPTEKAHGLATMKIAEALVRQGFELEMIAPWRFNPIQQDPFSYYGVERNFKLTKVPSIDLLPLKIFSSLFFYVNIFSFIFFVLLYILIRYGLHFKSHIFFSHDHIPLYFFSLFSTLIFFDIHDFPSDSFLYRRVLARSFGLAVQTKWKVQTLKERFSVPPEKVMYWPNGTDVSFFSQEITKEEARKKLNLPSDKKIVVYTGHLFRWKGVETFALTAPFLGDDAFIYIVGGTEHDRKNFQRFIKGNKLPRITLIPFQPREKVLLWLKAADVLVLPNTAKEDVSKFYTSPMKMFEYMASGMPIVASRINSITEILNVANAFLFEPDDPKDLARTITFVLEHLQEAEKRAQKAQTDVRIYTWDERARRIKNLMVEELNL